MRVIHVHNVMHTFHYITQDMWAQLHLTLCLHLLSVSYFLTLLRVSSLGNNSRWRKWKKMPWISSFKVKHLPPWHQPVIIGASRVLEIYYSLYALPPWDFVPLMYKEKRTAPTRWEDWRPSPGSLVLDSVRQSHLLEIFLHVFISTLLFIFQAAASGALMLKTEYVKCLSMRQRSSLGVYLSTSSPSSRLALTGDVEDPRYCLELSQINFFHYARLSPLLNSLFGNFFTGFPADN